MEQYSSRELTRSSFCFAFIVCVCVCGTGGGRGAGAWPAEERSGCDARRWT
jgi:hypothetical protein